jgi:hypothetical protein
MAVSVRRVRTVAPVSLPSAATAVCVATATWAPTVSKVSVCLVYSNDIRAALVT